MDLNKKVNLLYNYIFYLFNILTVIYLHLIINKTYNYANECLRRLLAAQGSF